MNKLIWQQMILDEQRLKDDEEFREYQFMMQQTQYDSMPNTHNTHKYTTQHNTHNITSSTYMISNSNDNAIDLYNLQYQQQFNPFIPI